MIITYLAAPLMIFSGIPQIKKLMRTKNSTGISIWTFAITWVAVLLLFIEATLIEAWALALADFCSLVVLLINIILIKKYSPKNAMLK
jgi:uncharacterized protein with PQ loop repeat